MRFVLNSRFRCRRFLFGACGVSLAIIVGCAKPKPAAQRASTSESRDSQAETRTSEQADDFVEAGAIPGRTHIVQPKETLYGLAQRYYGNKNEWRKIYYANRNRLSDPNNLPVGARLIIP
jgi:nucleoid-associated protein YgaU